MNVDNVVVETRTINIDGHDISLNRLDNGFLIGEAKVAGVHVWPVGHDIDELTRNARAMIRNLAVVADLPQANSGRSA